jgi:membrane protease YdiL (CAAX protease family)
LNTETNDLVTTGDASLLSSETAQSPKPPMVHRIFIGPDGIRAGWSLLIFVGLLAALMYGIHLVAVRIHPPTGKPQAEIGATFAVLNELFPFLAILFITWLMSKIERRPNGVYGLGGGRKAPLVFIGAVWGFLCLSLLVGILWKSGLLVIDKRLLFGADVLRYGALWLFGFLLVGLLEEYLTRGYLQYTLTRGLAGVYQAIFKTQQSEVLGFWTAALCFSLMFGLGHSGNPGESPIGLLSAGSAGLVFCFSLWRTGSLWWAVGFHMAWDWAQSFLYGVADSGLMVQHHLLATHPVGKPILSGGTTGPEGSIFVIAVLLLIAVIIATTLPKREHGYLHAGVRR